MRRWTFFSWLLGMSLGLALIVPTRLAGADGTEVYDGFETPFLSRVWLETRFFPGAVVMQSRIVRAGRSAAEITVREHDLFSPGVPASTSTERDELKEAPELWSRIDRDYSYSFSMFIPLDFPVVPARLVIAQWMQLCPGTGCLPNHPVIAVRYVGGELIVSHQVGPEKEILYHSPREFRNRWLDFRFDIRFSQHATGRIKTWLDRQVIVDYHGKNAYAAVGGYSKHDPFFFKMGLYRDTMRQPMTIYVDEYRKQEIAGGTKDESETAGRRE
jgi:Polysaccharide lyase